MNIKNNKKHTLFAFVLADGQIFNASFRKWTKDRMVRGGLNQT